MPRVKQALATDSRPVPDSARIDAVVFDLGKVLLDWDPRYFYRRHFAGDEAALEDFIAGVVPGTWVIEMDRGRSTAECVAERQALFPQHAELLGLWAEGWVQMLRGEIEGTAAIIRSLKARGMPLYALTNFSMETFPLAQQLCPTLRLFDDAVVSGAIGLVKPDPAIYAHAERQCGLTPERVLFIDDLAINVAAARAAGWKALQFHSPEQLHRDLKPFGLLDD